MARERTDNMAQHVKAVGILHLVLAGMTAVAGMVCLIFLAAIRQFIDLPPESEFLAPLIGIVPLLMVFASVPGLLAGIGILQRRPWGRILGLVVGALHLINFPIGTALGVYGFWTLLHEDVVPMFEGHANPGGD